MKNEVTSSTSTGALKDDRLSSATAEPRSPFEALAAATILGVNVATSNWRQSDRFSAQTTCELNERQQKIRECYIALVDILGSLPRSELEPGQRREALCELGSRADADPDVFLEAFERVFHTTSRKISDRAKASALRFSGDFSARADRSKLTALLIDRLGSLSPSEASAAAVGLSEVADMYALPALYSARDVVRWPTVIDDLNETISEILPK